MSKLTFNDCNGLAGFMSLGFVNTGMEMNVRTGTLDFGNKIAEVNRHLLGDNWSSFFSDDPNEWPDRQADVVLGCPPCSGWSVWSGPSNRGVDAKAHEHTQAFMKYAARVKPKMIIFECVQQAYSQGRETMIKYRNMVEELSGKQYDIYHVKMNNLQVGGFSYRPRYFWTAVERGMPFGAQAISPEKMPTLMDVIGDLQDLEVSWDPQPYRATASSYVSHLVNSSGVVDGHMNKQNKESQRIKEIFDILGNDGWKQMMPIDQALRAAVTKNNNTFPQAWLDQEEKIRSRDFDLGFSIPCRWSESAWCHVLTGGALDHVIHPVLERRITHREAARIQGLPDNWRFNEVKTYSQLAATWGKAVAVQAAEWIAKAAKAALEGTPNGPQGEPIGDREWLLSTDAGFSRKTVKNKWYATEK